MRLNSPMNWLLSLLVFVFAGPALAQSPEQRTEQAVLAGGCFWCMESDFKGTPGVIEVMSGYSGGALRDPSYEDVITQRTGHYEVVRITFDPAKISYEQLLSKYWRLIDPTDAGGQFCDRGPSYRSAVFATPDQQPIATKSRDALAKSGKLKKPVVTEILPLGEFWPAEPYHRDYSKRNPERYARYVKACGREEVLKQVWGG